MDRDLRDYLRERGAGEAEIDHAEAEGWLPLLTLDRLLMPGVGRHDIEELAAGAGTTVEVARRLWRSLGFPDVPDGLPAFSDEALHALRSASGRFAMTPAGATVATDGASSMLRQTRVISSALARIAAVEADMVADLLAELRLQGVAEDDVAKALVELLDWPAVAELVDYVHRLQFRAAAWRRLARGNLDTMVDLAVGFADLSGYTALSTRVDARELDQMLLRWEELGYDTVAEHGARVVKTIGDEVMFVGLADAVAGSAVALSERASADPLLLDVQIGVARGGVLARDGDVYGPVVNLASRLTGQAPQGTILATGPLRDALVRDERFTWEPLGRREVRDFGEVELFRLGRAGP